jgi:decaprenylphospho-beta-D-ribofuranose 2-oxidase
MTPPDFPRSDSGSEALVARGNTAVIRSWGRMAAEGYEVRSEDLAAVTCDAELSRGLGRSYGDSSLPARPDARVVSTPLADRILAFDPETGVIRTEAGFTLAELYRLFLPRRYFTPVSPGTKWVTIGGMVAADVHGKNHHQKGSFGQHVHSLTMRVGDRIVTCSPRENADLFYATTGGMGLTGHILEVEFQLERIPSPWIYSERRRIGDIDEFTEALRSAAKEWPYTVGWIDCITRGRRMGRGVMFTGRWATPEEAPNRLPSPPHNWTVPCEFPEWVINHFTTSTFNALYRWGGRSRRWSGVVHPHSFFYPLDAVLEWNKVYGKRGMTQYQCVFPHAADWQHVRAFLQLLTDSGEAAPLCVIKDFGREAPGLLSFPREGLTLSVDLPVRDHTQALVDTLNELVLAAGGRIYLAKDAFTRAADFAKMETRLAKFNAVLDKWVPDRRHTSAQSRRLLGGNP